MKFKCKDFKKLLKTNTLVKAGIHLSKTDKENFLKALLACGLKVYGRFGNDKNNMRKEIEQLLEYGYDTNESRTVFYPFKAKSEVHYKNFTILKVEE